METVAIPQKLKKTVRGAARNLGVSENDLMTNAVLFYLAAVKKNMDLKDELRMWEDASDSLAFLKNAEASFEFWNNPKDAVYDEL